jgi:ubiquinol-cytochrome c reductase cytochrome b subunit
MLKLFNGPLEVVGAVVLPGVAVLALILAPFLDRGQVAKVTRRFVAIGVVLLGAIGWSALTMAAVASTPPQEAAVDFSYPTDWIQLTPDQLATSKLANIPAFVLHGAAVYRANHCSACHTVNGAGGKIGPVLNGLSKRQTRSWVEDHFADPQKLSPGTSMPPYPMSPQDRDSLTSYLFSLPDQ